MNHSIPETIRRLRRERGMMQEQLAEALGVSAAAVSKWERGTATPELNCLLALADLFQVSLDALVGYTVQGEGPEAWTARILTLQQAKNFTLAAQQAEEALGRYPNHFSLVCRCGEMYQYMGLHTREPAPLRRAMELLERAVLLLPQNTDPEIDQHTLRTQIAHCCLALGEKDRGLAILKAHNVYGAHDALIGLTCAVEPGHPPAEAARHLMRAFSKHFSELIRTMMGYINYYIRTEQPQTALDTTLWLISWLDSLKEDRSSVAYVDKLTAPLHAECAHLVWQLGQPHRAAQHLEQALHLARAFDAVPVYGVKNLRFIVGDEAAELVAYDDMGATALAAVEDQLDPASIPQDLAALWKGVKKT